MKLNAGKWIQKEFQSEARLFFCVLGNYFWVFFLYECTSVQNGISTVSDQLWFEVNKVDITCMQEMAKSYQTAIFDSMWSQFSDVAGFNYEK